MRPEHPFAKTRLTDQLLELLMLVQDSGQASEARVLDAVKECPDALAEAVA